METADSIKQYGVLVPAEGGYELVAGHRRHRASELAEKETMGLINTLKAQVEEILYSELIYK